MQSNKPRHGPQKITLGDLDAIDNGLTVEEALQVLESGGRVRGRHRDGRYEFYPDGSVNKVF